MNLGLPMVKPSTSLFTFSVSQIFSVISRPVDLTPEIAIAILRVGAATEKIILEKVKVEAEKARLEAEKATKEAEKEASMLRRAEIELERAQIEERLRLAAIQQQRYVYHLNF